MHQLFASSAPIGPGNSGAFNFSNFKALLKARHVLWGQICVKFPAKSPGSPEADNNGEQLLGVVLMKLKYERGARIFACKCTGAFANKIRTTKVIKC